MQAHSSYLDKKREFIIKNDSLSAELLDFYKEVYISQERFSDALAEEICASFKVSNSSAPFLKSDKKSYFCARFTPL